MMGTNYYVRINECACCNRYDELHVGKSGTSVQAYVKDAWPGAPAPTPIGEILSWADWRKLLGSVPHTCWNEYGDQLTDPQLVMTFEGTPLAARRRQYDWMVANRESLENDWLDDDGFSVCAVAFS